MQAGYHILEGVEDLKMGGEGMKGFYDKILPSYLNQYAKKWGAQVEKANLGGTSPQYEIKNLGTPGSPNWAIVDLSGSGNYYEGYASARDARGALAREFKGSEKRLPPVAVHSLPITPAMKAEILSKGQPLYSAPGLGGAVGLGQDPSQQQQPPLGLGVPRGYQEGGPVIPDSTLANTGMGLGPQPFGAVGDFIAKYGLGMDPQNPSGFARTLNWIAGIPNPNTQQIAMMPGVPGRPYTTGGLGQVPSPASEAFKTPAFEAYKASKAEYIKLSQQYHELWKQYRGSSPNPLDWPQDLSVKPAMDAAGKLYEQAGEKTQAAWEALVRQGPTAASPQMTKFLHKNTYYEGNPITGRFRGPNGEYLLIRPDNTFIHWEPGGRGEPAHVIHGQGKGIKALRKTLMGVEEEHVTRNQQVMKNMDKTLQQEEINRLLGPEEPR